MSNGPENKKDITNTISSERQEFSDKEPENQTKSRDKKRRGRPEGSKDQSPRRMRRKKTTLSEPQELKAPAYVPPNVDPLAALMTGVADQLREAVTYLVTLQESLDDKKRQVDDQKRLVQKLRRAAEAFVGPITINVLDGEDNAKEKEEQKEESKVLIHQLDKDNSTVISIDSTEDVPIIPFRETAEEAYTRINRKMPIRKQPNGSMCTGCGSYGTLTKTQKTLNNGRVVPMLFCTAPKCGNEILGRF